ncbi:MAG: MobQ family relaxase, partial [Stellaceae bacterium]
YRLSARMVQRSHGRSVVAAAAYRAAIVLADERTGLVHDYTRRSGVLATEIMTPEGAPAWMRDRARLWNGVEVSEVRRDSVLAREVQLSLPHELSAEARAALVREFVQENFVKRGMVADVALHAPSRQGDRRNHHAHVLLTTREITPEGFGRKERGFNSPELLHEWRANWARMQNRYLAQGLGAEAPRVSHLSYAARGIDRVPGKHLGPSATTLERRRQTTERGRLNRGAAERTARLNTLRERQDAIAAKLAPPDKRHLGQIAAEMVGLKERLEKARAEQQAALRGTLDALKGRRAVSEERIEQATLVPFDREVRGAVRELDHARQQAGISMKPALILAWFRSPGRMLWNSMKRSVAVDIATFKLDRAARAREQAAVWVRSPEGRKFVAERVTALRSEYSALRTTERRIRRGIVRLERDLKAATGIEKVARALKEGELVQSMMVPARALNTTDYLKVVQGSLRQTVQQLQPQQAQKLQRLLTLGLGLGRER